MKHAAIKLLLLCTILTACSNATDKQYYTFGDDSPALSIFKQGDLFLSSVLGTRDLGTNEFSGELDLRLNAPDRLLTPGQTTQRLQLSLLADADLRTNDLKDEKWKVEFFQTETGSVHIFFTTLDDGTSLWLETNGSSSYQGIPLIPSPLIEGAILDTSFDIYICETACTLTAQQGQLRVTMHGISKQETDLAFFDAMQANFSMTFSYTNTTTGTTRHYSLSGDFWVHPKAGIIKSSFSRTISSDILERDDFFTSLARTNIKLP